MLSLLITLIIVLVVIGFAIWLIQQIPMNPTVKNILIGVIIFIVVIWLLLQLPAFLSMVPHAKVK